MAQSSEEKTLWKFYKPEPVPEVIYYYCSIEAFHSILVSKKLWMCNAYSLNDFQEIKWINRVIGRVLGQLRNADNAHFFDRLIELYQFNSTAPYLACFSSEDDVLSQWRAYSRDGTGFCIGFSTSYFNIPKNLPLPNAAVAQALGIHKVVYEADAQEELVRAGLQEALACHEALTTLDREIATSVDGVALAFAPHLNRFSLVLKNRAFSEEKEWRIMHVPLIKLGPAGDGNLSITGGISALKFRRSGNNIVPYFELDFSVAKKTPAIIRVVQGPKNEVPVDFLKMLLASSGFGQAQISRSRATYR